MTEESTARRTRGMIVAIAVAVVVVLAGAGTLYALHRPAPQRPKVSIAPMPPKASLGQAAPSFTTATTAGSFNLETQKRPVLLEVFATWCSHCQRETAVINRLYTNYRARVQFLSVPGSDTGMDGTSPESQLDVLEFQQRFRVEYPIAAYDPSLVVATAYLKGGFPTVAIIGRDKKIRYITTGEIPYDELAGELNTALK